VGLRADGFESCIVSAPGFHSELELARHYRRPWRTRVGAYVDELLAESLQPEASPAQVRELPEADRAILRRALVASADCEREWRSLYGSHLTGDERLFAVMYWHWRGRQRTRQQLRAEHEAYLATLRETESQIYSRLGLGDAVSVPAAAEIALGEMASKFTLGELVSPNAFGAVKALEAYTASSRAITKMFENPLSGLMANISHASSMASSIANIRALTDSITVSRAISAALGSSVALANFDTSVAAAVTREPFKPVLDITLPGRLMPWKVPSGLAEIAGVWQLNSKAFAALEAVRIPSVAELVGVTSHIGAAIEAFRNIEHLGDPLRELTETMAVIDQFDRRWQNEALYFIVSGFLTVCELWEMRTLASLTREEVEDAVLLALEMVLSDPQFVAALRHEVERAPFINSSQRTNLDHALEHAGRREYVHACASLYWGLEGAFWEVGYATAVVTLQRTDPKKTTRPVGFESMVKRLKLGQELKTFMVRGLYGTTGNPYRHGGADSGERRQVLLGVAALTGWFEEFAGVQALTALVTATAQVLPAAVEQVLAAPRLLGP
jgi:hypothetical protein